MATNKYFKCPYCDKKFTREDLCRHLEKKHLDELPEGFTPLRVTFHVVNRKEMSYRRPCRVCKQPTEWDEVKGRYNFLCGSRQCYETHVEKMRSDMGDKIGINRQTATAEGLEKMLAGRRISGKYRFRDGHEVNYTGSYELKALEFFDKIMYIKPEDLMVPGPALKYELDGVDHIYIPDMYYIPYNLIIEVKTGGDRPNTNPQWKETRRKQIAKEKFIVEKTDYNYIRLTNNEFNQILSVFADLKMSSMEDDPYRVVHINESHIITETENLLSILFEYKSEIDKAYTKKGNIKLSDLTKKELNNMNINKYKYDHKFLSHIRTKNTKGYLYLNKNDLVACIAVETKNNNENWIQAIEITNKYRGYGLSKQLLNICVDELKANYLSVNKNNKLAYKIYSDYGFKTYNETDNMYFMRLKEIHTQNNTKSILDEEDIINEHMSAMSPMVGMNDTIIVNYRQNNAFSGESKLAISDSPSFDTIFTTDIDNKLMKMNRSFLSECKYSTFILRDSKDRINSILKEGEEVNLYEAIFNHKQYSSDQIYFEKGIVPYEDIYNKALLIEESIYDYIRNGDETDV